MSVNMRKRTVNSKIKVGKFLKIRNIFFEHINNNVKDYTILILLFIVGVILGVLFINNAKSSEQEQINNYINSILISAQESKTMDSFSLLRSSIIANIKLTVIIWFAGSTVIGVPFVYGIIAYRGFCIGYTVSSIIAVLGVKKGLIFSLASLFLQNLIFIPCILALGVSGLKLYRSIVRDKRRENIKIEIYRHTIFCTFILIGLILSSIVETYISTNLFLWTTL